MTTESLPVSRFIFHLFCSSRNIELVKENILCLRRLRPEARIVLIEDMDFPCPDKTKFELSLWGVQWRPAPVIHGDTVYSFQRPTLSRIVEEFSRSLPEPEDVLIYLKAETLLLKIDSLHLFSGGDSLFWGIDPAQNEPTNEILAMKGILVSFLHHVFCSRPVTAGRNASDWSCFQWICPPSLRDIKSTNPVGTSRWKRYDWINYPHFDDEYLAECVLLKPIPPRVVRKVLLLEIMRALVSACFSESSERT